jgi:hypothetical protein
MHGVDMFDHLAALRKQRKQQVRIAISSHNLAISSHARLKQRVSRPQGVMEP